MSVTSIVSSGRPAPPNRLVTSWPSIVPTVRLTLRTGRSMRTGSRRSRASAASAISRLSSARSRPWSCSFVWCSSRAGDRRRDREHRGEVEALGLPVVDRGARVEQLDVADRLEQRAEAQLREQLPDLLRDELHERDDELRLAGEPRAQLGVLGRDADRAGVEVADAHHDAAGHDQRRRREAELLGAEQRADDDVAAGLELAVDLDDDAVAQVVQHERLLGLGQADLPRRARVLERRQRGRARCRRRDPR